jgi:hypothetical protein
VNREKGGLDEAKRIANMNIDENFVISNLINEEEKNEDYEKYYNTYERLTTLAREREKLEKKRNKLLEEGNAN